MARLCQVVDVGAHPIDGPPPYAGMFDAGLCAVTGFEPQPCGLVDTPLSRFLPYALGSGSPGTLRICAAPGMTSLFEPNPAALGLFAGFGDFGRVLDRVPIETRRLDDVVEIDRIDYIKLDVQGSELAIIRSGRARLKSCVMIHTEVSFVPLYIGQPVFGDIDLELRAQGFMPHCFADVKTWPLLPATVGGRQLLEADVVYVRPPETLDSDGRATLALLAHWCCQSADLAARCLAV